MGLSEELFDRAVKVIPGGVNSPVRAYGAIGIAPRFIDRADGCHIYDVDGKEYVDYLWFSLFPECHIQLSCSL